LSSSSPAAALTSISIRKDGDGHRGSPGAQEDGGQTGGGAGLELGGGGGCAAAEGMRGWSKMASAARNPTFPPNFDSMKILISSEKNEFLEGRRFCGGSPAAPAPGSLLQSRGLPGQDSGHEHGELTKNSEVQRWNILGNERTTQR